MPLFKAERAMLYTQVGFGAGGFRFKFMAYLTPFYSGNRLAQEAIDRELVSEGETFLVQFATGDIMRYRAVRPDAPLVPEQVSNDG